MGFAIPRFAGMALNNKHMSNISIWIDLLDNPKSMNLKQISYISIRKLMIFHEIFIKIDEAFIDFGLPIKLTY